MQSQPTFDVVLLGYDRRAVDAWVAEAGAALAASWPRRRAAARSVGEGAFRVRLVGYHRHQVDEFVLDTQRRLNRG